MVRVVFVYWQANWIFSSHFSRKINEEFRENKVTSSDRIGFFVVDEAHLIGLGHDFRPDYHAALQALPQTIPVLANPATANNRVTMTSSRSWGQTSTCRGDH